MTIYYCTYLYKYISTHKKYTDILYIFLRSKIFYQNISTFIRFIPVLISTLVVISRRFFEISTNVTACFICAGRIRVNIPPFMTHPRGDLPIDVENRGAEGGDRAERVNAGKIEHAGRCSK